MEVAVGDTHRHKLVIVIDVSCSLLFACPICIITQITTSGIRRDEIALLKHLSTVQPF